MDITSVDLNVICAQCGLPKTDCLCYSTNKVKIITSSTKCYMLKS